MTDRELIIEEAAKTAAQNSGDGVAHWTETEAFHERSSDIAADSSAEQTDD